MTQPQPAFVVEVYLTTHLGDPAPRLRWASPGPGSIAQRLKLVGRYACFPIQDGGALLPPIPSAPPPAAKVPWPFPVSAHKEPQHG